MSRYLKRYNGDNTIFILQRWINHSFVSSLKMMFSILYDLKSSGWMYQPQRDAVIGSPDNHKTGNIYFNFKMHFRKIVLLAVLLFLTPVLFAHSINYALEDAPVNEVVWYYLTLGFKHIIPSGIDHILFVIGLCLLSTNIKTIFWQATAFTVAHSITLALSMKNIIVAPGAVVEPIIALSIVFVAVENILLTELKPWRILVVFLFGLIHGMGFASALNEIGLPAGKFYTSVIAFNAGVELGQVAVISAMFGCIIIPLRNKSWYRTGIVYTLSALIAVIASYWTIQRIFFNG